MSDEFTFRPLVDGLITDRRVRAGDSVATKRDYERDPERYQWGVVRRVAKDGSWADVFWGGWSKRHPNPAEHLVILDHR